jgi:hypothetical protein
VADGTSLTNNQVREQTIDRWVPDITRYVTPAPVPMISSKNGRSSGDVSTIGLVVRRCERRHGGGLAAAQRAMIEWDQDRKPAHVAAPANNVN